MDMRAAFITLCLLIFTACSQNDSLLFLMETSFTDQFSQACGNKSKCVHVVEKHMEKCFNKDIAMATIQAKSTSKKQLNTQHILSIQKCLSSKSGTNYWKALDMPQYILSQVK